jgi:hypothetical protein
MRIESKMVVSESAMIAAADEESYKDHIRRQLTINMVDELMKSPYMKFTQKMNRSTGVITVIARYNDEENMEITCDEWEDETV